MTPQFPFKTKYVITQGFDNTASRYPIRHGALDIVPLDAAGKPFPADIYPIFAGRTRFYADEDDKLGRQISVDTELDIPMVTYLKKLGYVPQSFTGSVHLIHLYLHCLHVIDKDGQIDQDQPIAVCGNTGMVYTGNPPVPVPPEQKGKPPYPGLHLHLQMMLYGGDNPAANTFNKDKDPQGRIDPTIILNYKPMNPNIVIYKDGNEYHVATKSITQQGMAQLLVQSGCYDLIGPDGNPDFNKINNIAYVLPVDN